MALPKGTPRPTKAAREAAAKIEELTGCKLTPAEATHLVCAECSEVLTRAQTHWVCARPGHGRLVPELVLFCALTGMPEDWQYRSDELFRDRRRDYANAFARAHNGTTPQALLKAISKAQEAPTP